ncbi:MAG: sel1 repeat family protein [Paenibacillus sp.]|nr:sel1 repeat family protein [Paenibacillus sp.]
MKKALAYYKQAVTMWEDAFAQFMVGIMYYDGDIVDKDETRAIEWISLSAEGGWSDAQAWLGSNYLRSSKGLAQKWYKMAWQTKTKHSSSDHLYRILSHDSIYLELDKSKIDYLAHTRNVLEMGSFNSQSRFAVACCHTTDEQEKNKLKSVFWYSITESGNFYHHFSVYLGTIYFIGVADFKKDYETAVACFQQAATSGDAKAQYCLATYYQKTDKYESFKWFMKAKDNGDVEALLKVAEAYCHGRGTPIDYKDSVQYFEKYLQQKDIYNQGLVHNLMGQMYANGGNGIKQNYTIALQHFTISVDQFGYKKGFTNLGLMYAKGYGVKRDAQRAYEYYKEGSERNCGVSKVLLEIMQNNL